METTLILLSLDTLFRSMGVLASDNVFENLLPIRK